MPPEKQLSKTMISIFIGTFLILIAIGLGIWWYVFFGKPNPPLPQASVTVQSSLSLNNTIPASDTIATSTASSTDIASASTTPAVATSSGASSSVAASGANNVTSSDENPTLPEESLSIDNATFTVEIASTVLQQARGLSNRPSLGANDGMLFVFSSGSTQSFWMKDMNFPLDMIWISGNTVVGFAQDAPAEPNVLAPSQIFYSPANTDKVLEVNAGTVAKYNIKVGDTVTIGTLL